MAKKLNSPNQLKKERQDNCEQMSAFPLKKAEEQAEKGLLTRQKALKKLGITKEFNYADHSEDYNYDDHAVEAQIETVDASIAPPKITIEQIHASHEPSPGSKLEIILYTDGTQARPAVRMSSVTTQAKRMLLAHCAE
jgi:hypothetical protein